MDDKNQKMSPRIIFVIALSAVVLLVVCCGAAAVLLNCRKAGRPSNAVGPVITTSMNKKSGMSLSFIFPWIFAVIDFDKKWQVPSDNSWWNAGGVALHLSYAQASHLPCIFAVIYLFGVFKSYTVVDVPAVSFEREPINTRNA